MAPKCVSEWDSWINPADFPPPANPSDGRFDLEDAGGGSDLKGTHHHNDGTNHKDVTGKCKENPHRIRFESAEGSVVFTYQGFIFDFNGKTYAVGMRSKSDRKGVRRPPEDDDVWVGVKTPSQ